MPNFTVPAAFLFLSFTLICCRSQTASSIPLQSACEILSKDAVAAVQGEQVTDATDSKRTAGDLVVSQCFYKLPTFSKSVSLEITNGPDASIEAYWSKRFRDRKMSEEEEEEERERELDAGKELTSEEKPPSGPEAVSGLGDEAFWTASQINGALFIRRGTAVYRVSLGGAEDSGAKLEKAQALANSFLNKKD